MIELTIKSVRPISKYEFKGSPYTPPPFTPTPAAQPTKNIQTEAIRRDNIVKRLNKECLYMVGDVVVAAKEEDQKKYGDVRVLSIMSSYSQMGKDEEWPTNDNPLIVHAKPLDYNKGSFYCTINFLKPKYPQT